MGRMASLCLVGSLLALTVLTITLFDVPFVQGGADMPLLSPDEMAFEAERSRFLDQRMEWMHLLRVERQEVIAELEEGHLSLDEAIESFRALNSREPVGWDVLRRAYPDRSEEELVGYQLAIYAAGRMPRGEEVLSPFVRALISRLRERFGPQTLIPTHLDISQS